MVINHSLNGDRKPPNLWGNVGSLPNGMFLAIYMGVILTTRSNSDDLQVQTQNTKPHEAFECLGLPSSTCTCEMFASWKMEKNNTTFPFWGQVTELSRAFH